MKYKLLTLFGVLLLQTSTLKAEPVVIGNASVAVTLSAADVKNIFLGKRSALPDGNKVEILEQAENSAIRDQFHSKFTSKTQSQLNSYWSRLVFTGKGKMPRQVGNSQELIEMISKNPKIIGYIDSSEVTDAVKVLAK